MSVLVVTSLGDLVVDLHTDRCPLTTKSFLKLCKIKYFNGCLFHTVQKDFTAQTGDPTGKGTGGDSIYKFLFGEQARFFGDEIHQDLKHSKTGTVAMATAGENLNASQFYFTLRDDLDYLDGKHTVFGEVAEGLDTLTRINEAYVDEKGRPFKNIRIKHTYILDDPFDDPPQLAELIPDASPEGKPKDEVDDDVRLEDDWVPMDEQLAPSELEEVLLSKEAHSRAVVLESIGDIPDAEIKPPDNVLFVCKLNPVTQDEDLNTIFSRFGNVVLAEIIRDFKTGDSLCYAFIEYEDREACEQAYFKMDNALIDDRRIHVDFSQSVSKLWSQYRRKGNQMDNGKGCFKCGATDHIARDCIGGPSNKMQPPKYILKDDNTQRGGDNKSSYEMVFDDDSPKHSKRIHENETEDRKEMRRLEKQNVGDMKYRENKNLDKRDSKRDENRRDERSRGSRENERKKGSVQRGSQRNEELLHEDRVARDRDHNKKYGSYRGLRDEGDNRKGEYHGQRRDGGGYQNTDDHGDRRGEKDYRKRNGDGWLRDEGDHRKSEHHGERRDREGYQKTDDHGDRTEREHKKRSEDRDKHGSHRQDRESRKRSADSDYDRRSDVKIRDRR